MGDTNSFDSPQPRLGGSHHLPPYSILYVAQQHLHPNGFYSQDSQGGVSKLSRFGLLGLWKLVTPSLDLGLGWGLKQSCSSPQDLSNGVSHSICTHWGRVDSWLFVVGSQTVNLTPGPSFNYNLCCRCPNGSCKAILDIYTSKPFQWYKERLKARCFAFCCRALKLRESRKTPSSHFWECESHPPTCPKVGLRHQNQCFYFGWSFSNWIFFGNAKYKYCLGSSFLGGTRKSRIFYFSYVNSANFQYHKIEKRNLIWSF